MTWTRGTAALFLLGLTACAHSRIAPGPGLPEVAGETHLRGIHQLTQGGTNAEAYWSFGDDWLTFQHSGTDSECDQIFKIRPDGSERGRVSNGKGRTTCSFFTPDDSHIIYSSTFGAGAACPPRPDMSQGYVWPVYPYYEFYSSKPDGTETSAIEPAGPRAYNAEATVCHDGSVVFTSDREGDLELYTGKLDPFGTLQEIKRITNALGYDGGAFFSPDCTRLVWRASRPRPGAETDEYKALLKKHLVKPTQLEIWVGNADGSHAHQVTDLGAASFAPYFTPDGAKILFASNPRDPNGRKFDLYLIATNGTGLERVTFDDGFDSFPMFSRDGKLLAFSSNRTGKDPHETNVFVAEWKPDSPPRPDPLSNAALPADRFQAFVEKLSSPETEGRGLGTAGLNYAEEMTEQQFRAAGLKPFYSTFEADGEGEGEGYKQEVPVVIHKGKAERTLTAHNILGTWGGACGKTKPIVIGAHLDHLGYGENDSLDPAQGKVHPGADDNASGVAAMLEAARIIAKDPQAKSCFVLAAFTGEETGVAGSSATVKLLKRIKQLPKAMLNLDMVGRMENNRLTVFGTDSSDAWAGLLAPECESRHLSCPGGGDGYGPSDHISFTLAKVPVLHFFTGPHADYHRSSDTADKINATGGIQAAEVVAAMGLAAASPKHRLVFKRSATPTLENGTLWTSHGAYLGTIPDYSSMSSPHGPGEARSPEGGVRLAGTRPGSPAEKAGVKEGDFLFRITTLNPASEHPIGTLEEFMKVLTDLRPGDSVTLGVRRGTEILALPATVGKRGE